MKEIKINAQDFYESLVPDNRRDDFYKKVFTKIFSLISSAFKGDFKTFQGTHKHGYYMIAFKGKINGYTVIYERGELLPNSYYTKVPYKQYPTKVILSSGKEYYRNCNPPIKFVKVGEEYISTNQNNIFEMLNAFDKIDDVFPSYLSALDDAVKTKPKKVVHLYTGAKTYDWRFHYLCLENDFFSNIKKGDIFNITKPFHIQSTIKDAYADRYVTFQRRTVNLLSSIPHPKNQELTCIKQAFGCQMGCMYECLAKTHRRKNLQLYNNFKSWKEKYFPSYN